jgi:phosphoglucomutase
MDQVIETAVDNWLNDPAIAEADKEEIRNLLDNGNEKELANRFFQPLEFGTGGMRGIIGAGINRVNIYTIGAAAQGLANYVAAQGEQAKKAGVAIACDSRRMSEEFAQRTACVMAGNGIKAYLFDALRPTPELSFAVRKLGCTAGVVITASHNPPDYNGFKAYWSDGVQVVPPHDENITEEVRSVGSFGNVKVMDYRQAKNDGLIEVVGKDIDEAFLEKVQASCLNPELCREQGKTMKIVFTPLHGTAATLAPEALRRRGFEHVIVVPEQAEPDGNFPTVKKPNPEEGEALDMGIELAREEGADLVIGTDPDADRMGIAVRIGNGKFELITGNQIAALMTYYICEQMTRNNTFPDNAVLVTTIVSGDMMKDIARKYGAEVTETLTGFKWIGQKICQYEYEGKPEKPSKTYIFGAEESYGYMPSTFVRDKDAITSTAYIAEMAAFFASQGKGLYEVLQDLFKQYGYYYETTKSLELPGAEGAGRIRAMMEELRSDPPGKLGDIEVKTFADIATGEVVDVKTQEVVGNYYLPSSDVVLFQLEDGTKAIARPSGTEPKIKFYVLTREKPTDLAWARDKSIEKAAAIFDDFIARAKE